MVLGSFQWLRDWKIKNSSIGGCTNLYILCLWSVGMWKYWWLEEEASLGETQKIKKGNYWPFSDQESWWKARKIMQWSPLHLNLLLYCQKVRGLIWNITKWISTRISKLCRIRSNFCLTIDSIDIRFYSRLQSYHFMSCWRLTVLKMYITSLSESNIHYMKG